MLCWTARCGSTNVTRPARAILRSRHTSDSRLDPLGRTVDQPLAFCSCHGRSLTPSLRWGRARTSPIAPAVAAGKIINPKTARSQILGGEPDELTNDLGAKGLGEIGIVGTGAAIANAVFHATGVRVRSLPITIDKLVDSTALVAAE